MNQLSSSAASFIFGYLIHRTTSKVAPLIQLQMTFIYCNFFSVKKKKLFSHFKDLDFYHVHAVDISNGTASRQNICFA